jgi:two-component system, OmpR family, KDP operon response regulator KdpE
MLEKKNTILIVDDEVQIRKMLGIFLDASDFKSEESDCGKQALRMCASIKPDLVLLDLGLPDMDGKEVIGEIRAWSQVPIVVLSVRAADEEVVAALDRGADDYIVKPFNADVLMARINANLRKAAVKEAGEPDLVNGPIRMDLVRHEAYLNGEKAALTPKEYELLRYFMINRGKMLTHKQILKEIWGPAHGDDTQYVRVYIGQLREKLEADPSNPKFIITEPGIGYRMETVAEKVPVAA